MPDRELRHTGLPGADVAIVGFGFAGLAMLAHLIEWAPAPLRVAVIAPDTSGHGLAYRTRNPVHLLNVSADCMGAWADRPDDFGRWLRQSLRARRCCAALGVPVPGPQEYAPRALFADYLDSVRELTIGCARERGFDLEWIRETATRIVRDGGLWRLTAGSAAIAARSCVLATGHEPRSVFGAVAHSDLHAGPWELTDQHVATWGSGPVVLIGTGLTAVDALLTVRSLGFDGRIVAFSRGGQLPRAHVDNDDPFTLSRGELDGIDSLPALLETFARTSRLEHDWRVVLDALRPDTAEIWQRFSTSDQTEAARHWSTVWSVHRHRMAPQLAQRISDEIDARQFRISATQQLAPIVHDQRLGLEVELLDGTVESVAPVSVIDCTGPELNWSRSRRSLLQGLVQDGICAPHHTGLGVVADDRHQVAEHLYAVGSALTGQLWESVAVPELRQQAATIASELGHAP